MGPVSGIKWGIRLDKMNPKKKGKTKDDGRNTIGATVIVELTHGGK